MGVSYDPRYGIQRIDHSCGASIGDIVTAYGQSFRVECIDDYGCYVCRNLDENCLASDDLKTFDDLDIDQVLKENDPRFTACGEGI